MLSDRELTQIGQTIADAVHPQQVVVFGSYARGAPRPDSDLDLLVVVSNEAVLRFGRRAILRKIRQVLRPVRVSKDILVYTRSEVSRWVRSANHVIAHACREGKWIYRDA